MKCPCCKKEWKGKIPNLKLQNTYKFGDKYKNGIIYDTICWHSTVRIIEHNGWPQPKLVEIEI